MLRQRLVQVPALGGLNARRTPCLAGTLVDQAPCVAHESLELLESSPGDPDTAGMAVVNEYRRAPGLVVIVGREAADVPSVAHSDQRKHRDLRMLGGV